MACGAQLFRIQRLVGAMTATKLLDHEPRIPGRACRSSFDAREPYCLSKRTAVALGGSDQRCMPSVEQPDTIDWFAACVQLPQLSNDPFDAPCSARNAHRGRCYWRPI